MSKKIRRQPNMQRAPVLTGETNIIIPTRVWTEDDVQAMCNQSYQLGAAEGSRIASRFWADYGGAAMKLTNAILAVDIMASSITNSQQLKISLQGQDTLLAQRLTEFIGVNKQLWDKVAQDTVAYLNEFISPRIHGIQMVLNEQDTGEYLRAAIEKDSGSAVQGLLEIRANLDLGGRPSGMASWRVWLAEAWLAKEEQHPNDKAAQILSALINDLAVWDKKRQAFVAHDDLTPDQTKALKSLGTCRPESASNYRQKLLKAYRER